MGCPRAGCTAPVSSHKPLSPAAASSRSCALSRRRRSPPARQPAPARSRPASENYYAAHTDWPCLRLRLLEHPVHLITSPAPTPQDNSHPHHHHRSPPPHPAMSNKGRTTPRVVCCAIPIARAAGKVLLITSRKRPNSWVCECSSCYFLVPFFAPQTPPTLFSPPCRFSRCRAATDRLFPAAPATTRRRNPPRFSAKGRMGVDGRGARSSSLERSLGRRSHHLSLTRTIPIPDVLPVTFCISHLLQRACEAKSRDSSPQYPRRRQPTTSTSSTSPTSTKSGSKARSGDASGWTTPRRSGGSRGRQSSRRGSRSRLSPRRGGSRPAPEPRPHTHPRSHQPGRHKTRWQQGHPLPRPDGRSSDNPPPLRSFAALISLLFARMLSSRASSILCTYRPVQSLYIVAMHILPHSYYTIPHPTPLADRLPSLSLRSPSPRLNLLSCILPSRRVFDSIPPFS